MTLVRNPPSGPPVIFDADVLSVFERTGDVVAAYRDYTSDQIANTSGVVPGSTLEEALDVLASTTGIQNGSGVSGSTVTDALDTLLLRAMGGVGYIRESFIGGRTAVTAPNTNANIGCKRWNFAVNGAGGGINGASKLSAVAGAIGIYRLTSPTSDGSGGHIYLGSLTRPPWLASSWGECTWRVRSDAAMSANERNQWGVSSAGNALISASTGAGFFAEQNANPNFQTVTSLGGLSSFKNTGVAIDSSFHDFRIVRASSTVIEFFIDGVLVSTHTSPGDPMPGSITAMMAVASSFGGGSATFLDVDDYEFIPA